MTTLAEIHAAVSRAVTSKRLGTPVFVRYQLHTQDKPGLGVYHLTQAAGIVRGWIGQALERVYGTGSEKSGSATLTLEFAGGATSFISWTSSPGRGLGIDLVVIGNHGVIYHDSGLAMLWDENATPAKDAEDDVLRTLIARALASNKPELVGGSR